MKDRKRKVLPWFLTIWVFAVVLIGSALVSYHQPFQPPAHSILSLVRQTDTRRWEAVHVLSGSCGCSQKVMRHLLGRGPSAGIEEHILIVEGEEPDLPETSTLLARLSQEGFPVTHLAAKNLPPDLGLYGVPLLVFASPERKVLYLGGYGMRGDQDGNIFQQVRSGVVPQILPVLGCAVGARLRRKADPFHLKY